MRLYNKLILFYLTYAVCTCYCNDLFEGIYKWPTIFISILVRNKSDALPYFLTCLRQLDYPKDRLYLWIYSDHNEDNTAEILQDWSKNYSSKYRRLHLIIDEATTGKKFDDQSDASDWTSQRFHHVINLREKALLLAKQAWADYVFMLDADVFLTNPATLKTLIKKNLSVVAPMLITDGLYSNFWAGMTDEYYYLRTDGYEGMINRKKVGCFNVPMIHSAVLISLRHPQCDALTYNRANIKDYDGPHDDIITFAVSAQFHDVNLTVCNDEIYGFIPIPIDDPTTTESEQVENVKLEALGRGVDLQVDGNLLKYIKFPAKTKFGVSEVYMINLERRKKRRDLMMKSFDILGIDVKVVKAVDGLKLAQHAFHQYPSFNLMPNYEDPYHKRPMKAGEIGCFLSHFSIWTEIAKRSFPSALILEDDIHFVPYFQKRFQQLLDELAPLDWDFVYIGRKVLMTKDEEFVSDHITKPLYSYWTLGYLISERGARKLIQAEPLGKMLPVDEFLPIMFDQHPNKTWKAMFPNRNLKAFSAAPLLVHPTHYTGEAGYVSDTEDSPFVDARPVDTTENDRKYFHDL